MEIETQKTGSHKLTHKKISNGEKKNNKVKQFPNNPT